MVAALAVLRCCRLVHLRFNVTLKHPASQGAQHANEPMTATLLQTYTRTHMHLGQEEYHVRDRQQQRANDRVIPVRIFWSCHR